MATDKNVNLTGKKVLILATFEKGYHFLGFKDTSIFQEKYWTECIHDYGNKKELKVLEGPFKGKIVFKDDEDILEISESYDHNSNS